ncbi:carbohydrate ABC transporter permease [Arthrobacter sp. NPDC058127]|uniref:carbohydrate ABC transporter permease n=1 Tax=Arthrobacter sp. NPDC058127 TaxID=3346351 RepID=UPI0036EAC715
MSISTEKSSPARTAAPAPPASRRRERGLWAFRLLLVWLFVASVAPLAWILRMSFSHPGDIQRPPLELLFAPVTMDSWGRIFGDQTFLGTLVNSVIIASTTTAVCMAIGSLAAYAFARFRFRGSNVALVLMLMVSFFPQVSVIIPLFKQFVGWGIINNYPAAIIPNIVFSLPTTVFVLTVFFREIPDSLEEAAKIDGATQLQTFTRVMLPLAVPGLLTAAILTFVNSWNDYLFANTFLFDASTWTATVQIPQFATQYSIDYGAQAAGALAVTVPLVLVVMIFQRNIVSGLTSGAVKG